MNMICSLCLNEICIFKESMILLPCNNCVYGEFDETYPICKECIENDCKFSKKVGDTL